MNASKNLPENYSLAWTADIDKDKWLMVVLQMIGLPWSLLVAALLGVCVFWLRPALFAANSWDFSLWMVLALLLVMVISLFLHELTHGLFFWYFTREIPTFGFKLTYAYAAAPGWYFDKSIYWLIGLAPLIALSLIGLAFVWIVPLGWLPYLLFGLFTNASGAIGDLYIVLRLAFEPTGTLVEDLGTGFRVFQRLS
jgi:hypothetical protein